MARVELYWFALTATAAQRAAWRGWLSPEERARVERYVNPAHGERYLAAHAHLRWLLARELGCAAAEVRFERAVHGKPHVVGSGVRFNLSHSGSLALVGVHASAELGVDVEAERARNFLGLAARFFSPREQAWLAAQPEGQRAHAFARLWTCKEAWMKADGRGLAVLSEPEVQLGGDWRQLGEALSASGRTLPGIEARTPSDQRERPGQKVASHTSALHALGRSWWVRELELAPGYAAAVVMAAPPEGITVERMLPPPLA